MREIVLWASNESGQTFHSRISAAGKDRVGKVTAPHLQISAHETQFCSQNQHSLGPKDALYRLSCGGIVALTEQYKQVASKYARRRDCRNKKVFSRGRKCWLGRRR